MGRKSQRTPSRIVIVTALLTAIAGGAFSLSGVSALGAGASQDFVLSPLYGNKSDLLRFNPDRGFRLELNVQLGYSSGAENGSSADSAYADVKAVWPKPNEANAIITLNKEAEHYEGDDPQLAQVYFYLTKYVDTATLPEKVFKEMDAYFAELERHNLKAVFRLAYSTADSGATGGTGKTPTAQIAVNHINQIARHGWFDKWRDQIHVIQAGVIGAWGEWDGGSANTFNNTSAAVKNRDNVTIGTYAGQKALLVALLENVPTDLYLQVRYEYNKFDNLSVGDNWYGRVGFHDDAIRGTTIYSNNTGYRSGVGSANAIKVHNETKLVPMDGEMYWGWSMSENPGNGDGLFHLKHMRNRHFSSFSIVHDYKERELNADGSATPKQRIYSMLQWQSEYVNTKLLDENGLPYDPDWLKDEWGNPQPRTVFDYARDYVGYYLKATAGSVTVNGSQANVALTLINYGFSAPLTLESCDLVLLDVNGNVVDRKKAYDLDDLQAGTTQTATVSFSLPQEGAYQVAFELRSSNGVGARLANTLEFRDGFNILGTFVN